MNNDPILPDQPTVGARTGSDVVSSLRDNFIRDLRFFFQTQSARLVEQGWRQLTQDGPQQASRTTFLKALSSVEAILIRAAHATQTENTYISDVSLDTAIETRTGGERSTGVEECRCPAGYRGTSCEVRVGRRARTVVENAILGGRN